MPRRNRRVQPGPSHSDDWPRDLRPLIRPWGAAMPLNGPEADGVCRWTGKTRYPDERAARVALAGAVVTHNRGRSQRREARAYPCVFPGCHGGWHLTSQRTPPVPAPRPSPEGVSGVPGTIDPSQPAHRSTP